MKKTKIILPIALTLTIIIAVGLIYYFFRQNWQVYENSHYSFSIKYPKGWTLGEAESNNAGRNIYSPDKKISCYAYGFANALTNDKGKPQILNEFIAWLTSNKNIDPKDEMYMEILESKGINISGRPGVHLITKEDGKIKEAVYTLGDESGIGFFCIFPDAGTQKMMKKTFYNMAQSIKINKSLNAVNNITGTENCTNLINGVIEPFKDVQTFMDDKYTEVTLISRANWDKKKLPLLVTNWEAKNYSCYPLPLEFKTSIGSPGVFPERQVTKMEWRCELKFKSWKYAEGKDTAKKTNLEKQGYKCIKESCSTGTASGFAWQCTK